MANSFDIEGVCFKRFDEPKRNYCVYLLMLGEKVVYVGETENITRRVEDHRYSGKVFDSIMVHNVATAQDALDLELAMIKLLDPPLNTHSTTRHSSKAISKRKKMDIATKQKAVDSGNLWCEVWWLPISEKVRYSLIAEGFCTLRSIADASEYDLIGIRNISTKKIPRLKAIVNAYINAERRSTAVEVVV